MSILFELKSNNRKAIEDDNKFNRAIRRNYDDNQYLVWAYDGS